jgi:hypothetical protein
MRFVYLDTNVYNALSSRLSDTQVTALPEVLDQLGIEVLISPVNILEILASSERPRKERLVWVAQHLAAPPILPEVESIVIDYAARIVKDPRVEHLRLRRPTARPPLREEWEKVYNDKRRTLHISEESIRALMMMKKVNALHHAITSRGLFEGTDWQFDLRGLSGGNLRVVLEDVTSRMRSIQPPTDRAAFYQQNVALVTAIILCIGLTPFPEPIDDFWNALGRHKVEDRLDFVWQEHPELYLDGPVVGLSHLLWWQSQRAFDRGNLFDAYHLQYLQVVSEFLTKDAALLEYGAGCAAGSRPRENMRDACDFIDMVVAAIGE